MMRTLGMIGFHQSYTYFAWHNQDELIEYMMGSARHRPPAAPTTLLATTHDILTPFMTNGKVPAFKLRAPSWRPRSARPGASTRATSWPRSHARAGNQIDNEKYGTSRVTSPPLAATASRTSSRLNAAGRSPGRTAPAAGHLLPPHQRDQILAYSKRVDAFHSPTGRDDVVLTVVNLDPHGAGRQVYLNLEAWACRAGGRLSPGGQGDRRSPELLRVVGAEHVRLDPFAGQVAHVFSWSAVSTDR